MDNVGKFAYKMKHGKSQTRKSLLLFTEMDASLVGAPVFKTVCVALILSQVGSIPTHLRQINALKI